MNNFKAKVQVKETHYDLKIGSFNNLFNQINDIIDIVNKNKIKQPKVLIIGVGDNLLSIVLKEKYNYKVESLDIDKNLNPDYTGSVDSIEKIIKHKYDIIVCAHVLEHLPYKYFNNTLKSLSKLSKFLILYLPIAQFGPYLKIGLLPLFEKTLSIFSTWFFKKHKFDGQHYWELGTKGYSVKDIRKQISKCYLIENEYNPSNWKYSYNFVLKTK